MNIAKIVDNNTIEIFDKTQFDVSAIMHSGQIFRYFKTDKGFRLVVGKSFAEVFEVSDRVVVECSHSKYFWNYFDLDTDYNKVKQELSVFKSIRPAINAGGGIRILRSEFNEMVISFIISANNNIKRFTKTLNLLAENFGERLGNGLFAFPTLKQLSVVSEEDFKSFGCGYRAPYLVKAIEQLQQIDLNKLAKLPPSDLDRALQKVAGVGPKVSACVRLFSDKIHDLSICPMDTWLKKAVLQIDECDRIVLLNHKYAGIAQQYVFYYLQFLGESFLQK